jgi:acetolactate synthase-1/2/3 large subunit
MFKPVTKWNAEIFHPRTMAETVRKAFKVAQTEKPGSTHLELPEDVAAESVSDSEVDGPLRVQAPFLTEPLARQVSRAVEVLSQARRPILLVGNGVIRGQAYEAVRRFVRQANVPVVHTFMSKGVVPDSDPLSLYAIGLQMRDHSAVVIEQSDAVVAVGYDFVEYAPCLWNPNRDKHIVHVDVSPAEVDAHYIIDVGVLGFRSILPGLKRAAGACRPPTKRSGPNRLDGHCDLSTSFAIYDGRWHRTIWSSVTWGRISYGWPGCFPARCRTPASFRTDSRRWAWRCPGPLRPSSCFPHGVSWL